MTLGQRIQELRKEKEMSQEVLGEKLGVSRQAVSRWEMDGAVPEVDKLIAMSRIFGVSLNDLLQVEEGGSGSQSKVVLALPRPWRLGVVVLSLLTLLSLGANVYLGWRLAGVETRLQAEQQALNPEMPMIAGFDYDFDLWGDKTHIGYTFRLTVARQMEGLEVELQVVDQGGGVHVLPLTVAGGTVYTGEVELECPDGRYLTISALFRDALGNTYTQPVVELVGVGAEGGWRVETFWDIVQSEVLP
ncbi:MAG: helix-turn-helix transcriptional regulator [Lawsonibacter sp.]|jgi:transcriptional regulator with XRE-family HTH domain